MCFWLVEIWTSYGIDDADVWKLSFERGGRGGAAVSVNDLEGNRDFKLSFEECVKFSMEDRKGEDILAVGEDGNSCFNPSCL